MERTELYLKTIFCCMACDGEIAKEEIELVKYLSSECDIFSEVEIETCLNKWISAINENGALFLKEFLNELSEANLSASEQMLVVDFAIRTIEADKRIEYSEIKFFKKIRNRLSITDEKILEKYPDSEDFLLPDINVSEEPIWNTNVRFSEIYLMV